MNKYARRAQNHWKTTDPERYAAIPDPETFFSTLGEQAETQVQDLTLRLAGPDPPQEGYLEKVGRLNMARLQAEELVLSELILIAPPEHADDSEPTSTAALLEAQQAIERALRDDDEA